MSTVMSWQNTARTEYPDGNEWRESKAYRFHLLITKDDEDTFSVVVLNLPGVGTCGETEEDAMESVKEAICGAVEEYRAAGMTIPWKDTSHEEIPPGAKQKWIILDA
jgi:predicted RNase H-like HicB family nuclease